MANFYPHHDFMPAMADPVYYRDDFRTKLEDHMVIFRTNPAWHTVLPVDPQDAYRYEYNLYSYLSSKMVPAHLHWFVMRLNEMISPDQFGPGVNQLYLPVEIQLDQLRSNYTAVIGS